MNRKKALITGASGGIGKAYAYKLGARDYDLVLVARSNEKLRSISKDIINKYNCQVTYLTADLTKPTDLDNVSKRILELDRLDILVNNAGFGTYGLFYNVDISKTISMIDLHITACTTLVYSALHHMYKQKSGSIINLSSIRSFAPFPGGVNYVSTKAYLNSFSQALYQEVKSSGIKVQALCPGFTTTGFHDTDEYRKNFNRKSVSKNLWMTADAVVEKSLSALKRKKVIIIPGFTNKVLVLFASGWLTKRLAMRIMSRK